MVLDDLETGFRANVNARARLVSGSVADEDAVRRGAGLRARVPPGRAQGRVAIGRASAAHRHRQHARHAHRAEGRARRRRPARRARVVEQCLRRRGPAAHERERRCGPARRTRCRSSRPRSTAASSRSSTASRRSRCATSTCTGRGSDPTRRTPRSSRCSPTRCSTGASRWCTATGSSRATSRYISDVVAANLAAANAPAEACAGRVYNIAGGTSWSLLDVLHALAALLGVEAHPQFVEPRRRRAPQPADPAAAAADLGFRAESDSTTASARPSTGFEP